MSISEHFKSSGRSLMESIRKKYGDRSRERATAPKPPARSIDSGLKASMRSAMRGRGKGH